MGIIARSVYGYPYTNRYAVSLWGRCPSTLFLFAFFKRQAEAKRKDGTNVAAEKVNRKRNHQIKLWVSDEELELLNKLTQKSGLSRTELFISVLQKDRIVIIEDLQDICIELKKQGINLNQALRFVYQYGDNADLMKAVQNCNDLYDKTKNLCIETEIKAGKKRR